MVTADVPAPWAEGEGGEGDANEYTRWGTQRMDSGVNVWADGYPSLPDAFSGSVLGKDEFLSLSIYQTLPFAAADGGYEEARSSDRPTIHPPDCSHLNRSIIVS